MWKHRPTKLAPLILTVAVALTGCATIRQSQARDTLQLLTAAGFKMQLSDNADQQQHLDAMPPYQLVSRTKGGAVAYTYADPKGCKCLYVGGAKEYSEYRRLVTKRPEWLRAAEDTWADWSR